jgi:hypothetical protein
MGCNSKPISATWLELGWIRKSIFFYFTKYEILCEIKICTNNFAKFGGILLKIFEKFRQKKACDQKSKVKFLPNFFNFAG